MILLLDIRNTMTYKIRPTLIILAFKYIYFYTLFHFLSQIHVIVNALLMHNCFKINIKIIKIQYVAFPVTGQYIFVFNALLSSLILIGSAV